MANFNRASLEVFSLWKKWKKLPHPILIRLLLKKIYRGALLPKFEFKIESYPKTQRRNKNDKRHTRGLDFYIVDPLTLLNMDGACIFKDAKLFLKTGILRIGVLKDDNTRKNSL